ncbi:Glucose dehydrogenase [FAD, quinone] [Orchesella cincta]|uniref:Glucose dehydrogenase [FAD, quinone] n=1 Tax=Orchesella cincta TaxID=48709 RepID=A0A1D2MXF2_ORCCI|nr:Glucose dehydrogenase [FAD, quinone] [Orchesella cincta]
MTIPVGFITRYAIPLVIATLFLGDVDIPQQFKIFDKTQRWRVRWCYIANRLTASGENRVLLLEAGGDPNPILDVPFAQRYYWDSDMDWNYTTVKQSRACNLTGGSCIWPRGKALGGSSSVNGLDYDLWANFTGDQSWSWANVKDTFNSFEDYHGFYEETAGANHGYGGEMYVGKIDHLPGVEIFEEAVREKGIPIGDLNGGEEFTYGFSKIDYNIKNGMRCGTYQAFLEPILNRSNLVIYRYAYAIRIETISLGDLTYRAVGVTYERHGAIRTALAQKEVILSAGVVESPKLLLLSGIGPKEHLQELNITTLIDLPVGKYLQEHPGMDVVGNSGGFRFNTTFGKDYNTSEALMQFLQNGTGPMNGFAYETGYAPQLMGGYLSSPHNQDRSRPDVHVYIHEHYTPPPAEKEEMYFSVELAQPNSTGTIRLASSDPKDKPLIDPNFYEDLNEVEILADVIEILMDLFMNSTTFQKFGIQQMDVFEPCRAEEFLSRDYWRCLIQERTMPYFTPSPLAAWDQTALVFGISNLRVIDASVIPFVPSGNTNLPAMLIGARGAEIILSGQ